MKINIILSKLYLYKQDYYYVTVKNKKKQQKFEKFYYFKTYDQNQKIEKCARK